MNIRERYEVLKLKPFKRDGVHTKTGLFINEELKRFNVLYGAVRSSKTYGICFKIVKYLLSISNSSADIVFAAPTLKSLERNILTSFFGICIWLNIDKLIKVEYIRPNLIIFGKLRIYLMGASTIAALTSITGGEIRLFWLEEAKLFNSEVLEEMVRRMSHKESKMIMAFNSDNPNHYINRSFTYNEELINKGFLNVIQFELMDNPFLPEEYVESMLTKYPEGSIERDLYIYGINRTFTGKIYSTFTNDNVYTSDLTINDLGVRKWFIGMDYGAASVTCAYIMGINHNYTTIYVMDEYYHDERNNYQGYTDYDHVKNIYSMINKYNINVKKLLIYIPHDAASIQREFNRQGLNTYTYMTERLEDIESIKDLLRDNKVIINEECGELLRSIESYVWDSKKAELGKTVPLKDGYSDHACDALTALVYIKDELGKSFVKKEEKYEDKDNKLITPIHF